jgi:hypothetical protein
MKRRPHHFYCEIYFQNFYFCPGWKRKDVETFFGVSIMEDANGVTLASGNGIIIWIESTDDLDALCHESIHAAKFLFGQKGVLPSNENDEPLAYLATWIFKSCRKRIRVKK